MGHLYPGRGIELIFKVAEKNFDVDFHLMGGTSQDINFWNGQKKIPNMFIHGFIPPGQVPQYRNKCDVLLAPYQEQCAVAGGQGNTAEFMSPLKIFEYMASRKSIIASDLPALREVLGQNNAILVPPGNVDAWSRAICQLKEHKIRKQISDRAYHDFVNHYTWKKRAQNVLE